MKSKSVIVRAPATTANLGPGFDVLGLALSLYNEIELALAEETEVTITGEGAETLPRDESRLVLRSAALLAEEHQLPVNGWRLRQHNRIPLARGLGSSSAAIVAGLVAANALFELGLSKEDLLERAAKIEGHPDNVAPCLYGGLTVCCANERLCCLRLPPPALKIIVAIPDFEINTEAARRVLPTQIAHADGVYNTAHVAMTLAALLQGDYEFLACGMRDRLHEPYRAPLVPGYEQVREAALRSGAYGVCLSGSGPTVAAFADHYEKDIAAVMQQAFAEAGVTARIMILEPSERGAEIVAEA